MQTPLHNQDATKAWQTKAHVSPGVCSFTGKAD